MFLCKIATIAIVLMGSEDPTTLHARQAIAMRLQHAHSGSSALWGVGPGAQHAMCGWSPSTSEFLPPPGIQELWVVSSASDMRKTQQAWAHAIPPPLYITAP